MFSFFFERLYHIQDIQQAFKNICLDKMLSEGYFDMSLYIYGRIKKKKMSVAVLPHRNMQFYTMARIQRKILHMTHGIKN